MSRMLTMLALVAAPVIVIPSQVDAQQRGSDRAPVASTQGRQTPEARENGRRTAPAGLKRAWEGRTPPPALQRRFPDLADQPDAEPAPEATPEPDPVDNCSTTFILGPDGTLMEVDCNGTLVGRE